MKILWCEQQLTPLFFLSSRNAGEGNLDVQIIHDESQIEVPVRVIDNKDNTYTVELSPPETGSYTTNLHYGGLKVPSVPKVVINPAVDMTKIKVDGLEPSKFYFFYFYPITFSSHLGLGSSTHTSSLIILVILISRSNCNCVCVTLSGTCK